MNKKPVHIAVIRLSAMGDVAMTVPLVNALVKKYPGLKITVISRPHLKPLFTSVPNVTFFDADTNGRHKGVTGIYRMYKELRALGIDGIADLHNVLRSKVLRTIAQFHRLPTAVTDKARSERKALTRKANKIFKPLTPVILRHANVFKNLGYPLDLSSDYNSWLRPKLLISAETQRIAGAKTRKWIGIAPFAKHPSKVYPQDLMSRIILGLRQMDYQIFLFGSGAEEIAILEKLREQSSDATIIAGKLSFEKELEIISNLDVMLSMDSANAHIAAIYGVPTVTLWGATHPYAGFAPFNQPAKNAITSNRELFPMIPTSVYGNKNIAGYEDAMRTIDPETVIEKIRENLG